LIGRMNNRSMNRWYLLALASATFGLAAGAERMCLPVLFNEIAEGLSLGKVEVGAIWGMDPLAGVFVGLVAGLLADRFGIVRMMALTSILAGLFGGLRGLSTGFISMAGIMFVFGLSVAMMPTIVPKAAATWFFGRHLALANGVLIVGMMAGSIMATMLSATLLSPLLGGWRNVLFLFGIPPTLMGILWLKIIRAENIREITTTTSGSRFREISASLLAGYGMGSHPCRWYDGSSYRHECDRCYSIGDAIRQTWIEKEGSYSYRPLHKHFSILGAFCRWSFVVDVNRIKRDSQRGNVPSHYQPHD
jgi:MFS family permease